MDLHVIQSGSVGNCYILDGECQTLIIECGVSPEKVMRQTSFDARKIVGALVSHEHGDHGEYASKFAERAIDVYSAKETLDAIGLGNNRHAHAIRAMQTFAIGEFVVRAFDVVHDAAAPLGFIIEHPECGRILFATDTHYLRYNFRKLAVNHIMIEANYSEDELSQRVFNGQANPAQAQRVRSSHLSIAMCCDVVAANLTPNLSTVVLLHLSDANSNAANFADLAGKIAPYANVYVADRGLRVPMNINEI